MPGTPRDGRRHGSWEREAARFRLAAVACYAAALPLAALALRWSRLAWLAAGAAVLAGLCCERGAAFASRFARPGRAGTGTPGD
jgi:hypothetical protein